MNCEACGQPILGMQDASLSVHIPNGAKAHWAWTHNPCVTDGAYTIPAIRMATMAGVLLWTAHLLEKDWLTETDWADVIRRFGMEGMPWKSKRK